MDEIIEEEAAQSDVIEGSAEPRDAIERSVEAQKAVESNEEPQDAIEVKEEPRAVIAGKEEPQPGGRYERWKRDLLDITLRNPLINYKLNRAGVPLINDDSETIAALLSGGGQLFIVPQPPAKEPNKPMTDLMRRHLWIDPELPQTVKSNLENGRLTALFKEDELAKRLTDMFRKARLMQEESGASPLFAAVGFLKWQEADKPGEDRYSPLVLFPAELTRKSARAGYAVHMTGDEATANLSLIEMLRVNFKIDISALKNLPQSEKGGPDMSGVFAAVREKIAEQTNWEVIEAASIGLFSFSSFVLWNDLVTRENTLREHPLTGSMISGLNDPRMYEAVFAEDSDPHLYLPVDADSSQIRAAAGAADGKTFVLFGPPGTGKSQTITNIIGNALAHGKKVLFVAEKIAALNVVKKRLDRLGLWDFCLELHSNKAQKKNFYEQFDRVLELAENAKDVNYADAAAKLAAAEEELQNFNAAMNKKRKIGCSVFEGINKIISAGGAEDGIDVACVDITREQYEAGLDALKNLTDIGALLGGPVNSAFYHATVSEYTFALRDRVVKLSKEITGNYHGFAAAIDKFSEVVKKPKNNISFKKFENIENLHEAFTSAVYYSKMNGFNRFFASLFSGRYRKMRKCGYFGKLRAYIQNNAQEADDILSALDSFILPERGLREALGYGTAYQSGDDYALEIFAAAEDFAASVATLKDYCIYRATKDKCCVYPQLDEVVSEYHSGSVGENARDLFVRGFWQNWLLAEVSADPELNVFSPGEYATKRERFKAFTNHVSDISKKEIYLKMAAKLPNFKYASMASSEPGILMRAVKNRGRGVTIRGLFERVPAVLQSVKPCMLMSPLSAAQYLPQNYPQFDIVVFDEASQLLTCEAVGAVSRGKSTVVVGDPKQLPPTTFFRSQLDDGETDFEVLDMESVLDDMLALNVQQNKLLWHYRSEHESLIAFSNVNYYDGSLITFPSTDDTQSRVCFKKVEGVYDRGGTRTNQKEAEAVVNGLFEALADEEKSKLSYGIVTFNITQQNLIEDLVDKRLAKEPGFEKFFGGDNGVFIKNIESVQGDERDVIIFSVTYGFDKDGKMTANFGPVNRDGGWRRLNVAITRACKQIIIYSTIMPESIDLAKTSARGVKGLKDFMSFAINPEVYFTRYPAKAGTAFVSSVAEELKKAGLNAAANMGRSDNKIDVAVRGEDGKYILGILCDDGGTPMSASARDREYGRENFYRRMGWKITRVYALEWWQNRDAEIKRIINIINGGEDDGAQGAGGDAAAEIASATEIAYNPNIPLPQVEYAEPNIGPSRSAEQLYVYTSINIVNSQIRKLVEVEGPISEHILKRKLAAVWGVSRMTQKYNDQIDACIRRLDLVTNTTQNIRFFWRDRESVDMKVFRTNNGTRRVEDIPKEEFAVAALYIMQNALSISADDLSRETARLFGFTKTPAAAARIGFALSLLTAQGKIEKSGDTYKLIK